MAELVPQKINDLAAVAEFLDTHQLETDIGGVTPGKVTGAQIKTTIGSFPLADVAIVAVGGDDSNDGSWQLPFETLQAAHDSFSGSNQSLVLCQGTGFIDQNLTITRDNTFVLAPGLILFPSSGDALTINSPGANSIGVRIGALVSASDNALNIIASNGGGLDLPLISGDVDIQSAGTFQIAGLSFSGDLSLGASTLLNTNILSHSGNLDTNASNNTFGRLGLNWFGTFLFNGRTRIRRDNGIIIAGNIIVSELHAGSKIYTDSVNPITITLPEESSLVLPDFWKGEVVRANSGTVSLATQGSDVLIGSSTIALTGGKATFSVLKTVATVRTWVIEQ